MLLETLKKMEKQDSHKLFPDEICTEIFSYFSDDYKFVLLNCILVSKQWMNVIRNYSKFSIEFNVISDEMETLIDNSEFLNCFEMVKFAERVLFERKKLVESLRKMKNVTKLTLNHNNIGIQGAKSISQLEHLTSLNISINGIYQGAEFIGQLKNLTELDISNNLLGDFEGEKSISQLQKLTILNISCNRINDEGAKSLSQLNQLTNLNIRLNEIGDEGAKFIGKMQNLTLLTIDHNQIQTQGAKYLSNLVNLKTLYIHGNENIEREGSKAISEMKELRSVKLDHIHILYANVRFGMNVSVSYYNKNNYI